MIKDLYSDQMPGGWRKSGEYGTSKQADLVKRMVAETLASPRPTIKPSTEQAPSTAAALARDPSKDAEHFWRADPKGWEADKHLMRLISPDEYASAQAARHTVAGKGSAEGSSASVESKALAVRAFMYSKPAVLTEAEYRAIIDMIPIESRPPEPEVRPRTGWDRLRKLFRRKYASGRFVEINGQTVEILTDRPEWDK